MATKLARVPRPEPVHDDAADLDDSLASFEAEADVAARAAEAPPAARSHPVLVALLTIGALSMAAIAIAFFFQQSTSSAPGSPSAASPAPPIALGNVTLTSEPGGATIVVDGIARGQTPLKLQVPVGEHEVELTLGTAHRRLRVAVDSSIATAQHVEFVAPPVAEGGRVEITSDPAGARVSIDGTPRGTTPLMVPAVPAGEHKVTVSIDQTTVQRTVTVTAGATASVTVALAAGGNAAGWAEIASPVALQVYESGQLIGTTETSRLMLTAGRHDLEVANAALEFRAPLRVDIQAGRTTATTVAIPNGSLSVSALPWADVLIDKRPAGTTPIGNVAVPIGTHEITWRHPQLGERTRTVVVPARTPQRVGLDFTK